METGEGEVGDRAAAGEVVVRQAEEEDNHSEVVSDVISDTQNKDDEPVNEGKQVKDDLVEDDQSSEDFEVIPEDLPSIGVVGETETVKQSDSEKDTPAAASDDCKADLASDGVEDVEAAKEEWEDVLGSGRLKKKVLVEGEEDSGRPERSAAVTVDVIERIEMEGEIVCDTYGLQFNVGESEVMQALDLAVPLMKKGEECLLDVEDTFAYGDKGNGTNIPPGSRMFLTVRLLDWSSPRLVPDIPLEERAAIGVRKRDRGNKWYGRGDYSLAVQCYRKAVEYLDDEQIEADMEVPIDRFLLPPALQQLLEDRVKTCNNMAQAQMKLSAWDSAMASVKQVLKIQPNNEKALFRKAKILQEKLQTEEAMGILRRISRLYPNNKQCQVELTRLSTVQKKNRELEGKMSRKMLGLSDEKPQAKSNLKAMSIGLAALGGLGALAGAYLAKNYQWF